MKTLEEKAKHAAYMREYYWRTRDRWAANARRRYRENPDKFLKACKEWNSRNKTKVAETKRNYRAKHAVRLREYKRVWIKAWRRKNPQKVRAIEKRYAEKYPEKYKRGRVLRALKRRALKRFATVDPTADAFINFVRSKAIIPCYYCGRKISGKLAHIDHVIAISKQGNHSSSNLCASCPTCNLRKNSKMPSEIHFTNQPLLNL